MKILGKISALTAVLVFFILIIIYPTKANATDVFGVCTTETFLGTRYRGIWSDKNHTFCIPTDWKDLSAWFLAFALGIGGGLAVGLIIISGYKIMTSQGDPEKLEDGKETLTAAISGLIFIILSATIFRLIAKGILKL